jgi:hypothetical protein
MEFCRCVSSSVSPTSPNLLISLFLPLAGRIVIPNRDVWAIDGTVLVLGSTRYLVYSTWEGANQCLYISQMTSATTVGNTVKISTPTYSWEKVGANVNEGPAAIYHGGRTWIVFSASSCTGTGYKLGRLELTGSDPMNPSSWTKYGNPVFQSANGWVVLRVFLREVVRLNVGIGIINLGIMDSFWVRAGIRFGMCFMLIVTHPGRVMAVDTRRFSRTWLFISFHFCLLMCRVIGSIGIRMERLTLECHRRCHRTLQNHSEGKYEVCRVLRMHGLRRLIEAQSPVSVSSVQGFWQCPSSRKQCEDKTDGANVDELNVSSPRFCIYQLQSWGNRKRNINTDQYWRIDQCYDLCSCEIWRGNYEKM